MSPTSNLPRNMPQTLWTGGILTGKMAFQRDKHLAQVVPTIQLGALNVSPPVRMTPLSSKTEKMTIWRDKCLAKVVPTVLICEGGKASW